jgi:predicted Zn-dependent protease
MEWSGHYLDGQTAQRQTAIITFTEKGLKVTTERGKGFFWPFREIRQTQGFYPGEQIRLEWGGPNPEILLIAEDEFLNALHHLAPDQVAHFHFPTRRNRRLKLTLLAALFTIGSSLTLYFWGIPAVASIIAPHVPLAWEERMGEAIVDQWVPFESRCVGESQSAIIDDLVKKLTAHLPNTPYPFRVIVVNHPLVNAFAVPGGTTVLFRGLLERTETPEELAAVLAHELQHNIQRHATRSILQDASMGLLLSLLTGDATGGIAFGLQSAKTLGMMHYSRQNEEEADREGMRMLIGAGIDPKGMITFFEMIKKEGVEMPAALKYLSTHPLTEERIERLKSSAKGLQGPFIKLLPEYEWAEIRKICPSNRGDTQMLDNDFRNR